jgi:acyl-CoA thioesterase-1
MNYFVRKTLSFVIVIFCIIFFSGFALAQTLIVVLGDSLTEGFGVAKEEAYPHLLEKELQRKGHSVKVINAGISGSTSASAPSRLRWYIKTHPDIVILALGGNDGLRGLTVKHMKKNLSKAIELAQAEKILILLAGMQIPQNYGTEYTESFRNAFHELAKQYQLQMIPFLLKEVGGVSSLNQADGIHPNPEGHQIIVQTVMEYLEPLLPIRQ